MSYRVYIGGSKLTVINLMFMSNLLFCAYSRPIYWASVYRTIDSLVVHLWLKCFLNVAHIVQHKSICLLSDILRKMEILTK